jgi:hypothetical protein
MDKLVAQQTGHDTPMVWVDDGVEFFLSGADRSKYAHVIVNTNKSVYDEINQDPSWNPALEVGLHKGADAWSVELAFPWAELEKAGISRASVMRANFCRSRFAGPEESPHTAWSCTYGGFHVPERLGLVEFGAGSVALGRLEPPRLWGNQFLRLELHNRTDAPVTALANAVGGDTKEAPLPARGGAEVHLPIELPKPGPTAVAISWGATGQSLQRVSLPVTVPEPISVSGSGLFVVDGDTVTLVVTLRVAAAGPRSYRLRAVAEPDQVSFPAQPGRSGRLELGVRDSVTLRVGLVDARGKWVCQPEERRIIALPRG